MDLLEVHENGNISFPFFLNAHKESSSHPHCIIFSLNSYNKADKNWILGCIIIVTGIQVGNAHDDDALGWFRNTFIFCATIKKMDLVVVIQMTSKPGNWIPFVT